MRPRACIRTPSDARDRGQVDARGAFLRRAWILVFSSALMTYSAGPNGVSSHIPWYEIQNTGGFGGKLWVSRPQPTVMGPRPDGIRAEPAPHGHPADRGNDALAHRLACNLLVAKPGQRHAVGSRQFTRQRFDLHANLRGKKPGGAPAVADLEVPSAGAQKSVSAISKRSRGAHGDTRQYLCSPHPRLQRG